MNRSRQAGTGERLATLAGALALGLASPAGAQEALPGVNDYRLPAPGSTPRPRAPGPVDPSDPVAAPPTARATPTASPTPEARPAAPSSPAAAASPGAAPAAAASPRAGSSPAAPAATASPRPAPGPTAAASPRPGASPAASPSPAPTASAPAPAATTLPFEWRVHSAKADAQGSGPWLWLAVLLAFVLGAVAALFGQRALARRAAAQARAPEAWPEVAAAEPEPGPQPEPEPVAAPPAPRPTLDLHVNPLDVSLAARRMSATLVNATLSYELIVANRGTEPIGPIVVGGDMIAAHSNLPDRAQLEIAAGAIDVRHRIATLEPGESTRVAGEFRLPLTAITPIRSGSAALFVPLARFRVEATRAGAPPLVLNSAFVIGEDQERPGAALKPFRLDLGPRLYSRIGQRALALSA